MAFMPIRPDGWYFKCGQRRRLWTIGMGMRILSCGDCELEKILHFLQEHESEEAMAIRWQDITPLGPGQAMFQDSQGGLHSVPLEYLNEAREIDDIIVLARSPEEWTAFVNEQLQEEQWSLRTVLTDFDTRLLSSMGICWNIPMRYARWARTTE